jgi:hypothetical protein
VGLNLFAVKGLRNVMVLIVLGLLKISRWWHSIERGRFWKIADG